jgi:hypothetical protein
VDIDRVISRGEQPSSVASSGGGVGFGTGTPSTAGSGARSYTPNNSKLSRSHSKEKYIELAKDKQYESTWMWLCVTPSLV